MKFQVLRKPFAAGAAMFSAILIFCSFQFLQQTKNSIEYIGASKVKVRGHPGAICSRYCAAACCYVCIRFNSRGRQLSPTFELGQRFIPDFMFVNHSESRTGTRDICIPFMEPLGRMKYKLACFAG